MITIYQKTQKEIEEEKGLYTWAAREVKGIPKAVCPTYLMKKDGTKVDTSNLTEDQIMAIIAQDVQDFSSPTGSYKTTGNSHLSSFDLIKVTENSWTPSTDAILQTYAMEQTYGHIMADLRGSMDKRDIVGKARTIAKFQKESNGDFEQPTKEEVVAIIQQMSYNEKMKQQMGKTR